MLATAAPAHAAVFDVRSTTGGRTCPAIAAPTYQTAIDNCFPEFAIRPSDYPLTKHLSCRVTHRITRRSDGAWWYSYNRVLYDAMVRLDLQKPCPE